MSSATSSNSNGLELWGGVECTVNRVQDCYRDQLQLNGHANRPEDLQRFAELGLKALRYPVLWENVAPDGVDLANWSWADERLAILQELGIRPIVGLVHHGSGPPHTSLTDASFATGLADFAAAVARRYPWVQDYTPVNEPLTTARFSGLYGHWYPHGRDLTVFARALITQSKATVLAMRAIREVVPQARLIQTEDLGKVFSTHRLAYQAEWENERRWLSFDLLSGKLVPGMPMWNLLTSSGIAATELRWFQDHACPPDVLGCNYYITSERYLNECIEEFPEWSRGGNGSEHYADVHAVCARPEGIEGPEKLLREAWDRYRRPLALTEIHLDAGREGQLRWFLDAWQAGLNLRADGIDFRAVTAWSLLGAFDWNSLLVSSCGYYESGVFDLRGPMPRPTALANMLKELSAGRTPDHPVLDGPGWWQRPERLVCGPSRAASVEASTRRSINHPPGRALLVVGAKGRLGSAFARICEQRGLRHWAIGRERVDISDPVSVQSLIDELRPWAVVNAAGYARVDDAEHDRKRCLAENVLGPEVLAQVCASFDIQLLTFSSDLVFDGVRNEPYSESDVTAPLSYYGFTKAEAERRVLSTLSGALVIRTSALFGPWDHRNFLSVALRRLAAGAPFVAASDLVVSPTYLPDLVHASLNLLIDKEHGLWHLANEGALDWAEFARAAAKLARLDASKVAGYSARSVPFAAQRPAYSVLGSERGVLLPTLDHALNRYCRECEVDWNSPYCAA